MPAEVSIEFASDNPNLNPAPITDEWILEGQPVARNKLISTSNDHSATTWIWDCTAGRFNWYYNIDETIHVIEGSVTVRDHGGSTRTLVAGDIAFFPAGSSAEWTVERYVRKVAFLRQPLSRHILLTKRLFNVLKRLKGSRTGAGSSPAMFPTG